MNRKTIRKSVTWFVIFIMLFIPVETSYSLSLSNVQVSEVSDRYAIINWQSDKESSSKVEYGTNDSQLTQSVTRFGTTTNHTVLISSLGNNTVYYFNASSTNASESAEVGPMQFTTTATDTIPPFISTDLPDYYGNTNLHMNVQSEPDTQIYVYVNGNLSASGFGVTASDGTISLSGIRLQVGAGKVTPNEIKIVAIDPSGNRNEQTKIVNLDTTPPGITFTDPAPIKNAASQADPTLAFGEGSMTVSGTTDEPTSLEVSIDGTVVTGGDINTSDTWQVPLSFTQGDKRYAVRFYAVDAAGNVFDQTFTVIVDTKAPAFTSTSLDDFVTPGGTSASYILHQTITGLVNKPGMTVIVFVNNKTTSQAIDVKNNAINNVPTSLGELISKGTSGTLFGKDLNYVATADDTGKFSVDIEFETSIRLSDDEAKQLKFDTGDTWKNTVEIVAVDSVGRTVTTGSRTIYYTRCGSGGEGFVIGSPTVYPASIPEPLLQQGLAQFTMSLPLDWQGPVPVEKVEFTGVAPSLKVQPFINRGDALSAQYNLSVGPNGVFPSNGAQILPSPLTPQTKQIYAIVSLKKTDYDFGKHLTAGEVFYTLNFPLMLELSYNYPKPGTASERVTTVQRKCIDVAIQVEPTFFGIDQFNPKSFLLKMSKTLDDLVKSINTFQTHWSKPAQLYTTIGCGGLMVGDFVSQAIMKVSCKGKDIRNLDGYKDIDFAADGTINCGKLTGDDKSCCEATAKAQSYETKYLRPICDRIFCPSVPTFQKHDQVYHDLFIKAGGQNGQVQQTGAVSKCGIFGTPESSCKPEFLRAWGTVVLIDAPYKSEYDMVQQAVNNQQKSSSLLQSITRIDQATSNLCSAQPEDNIRIISTTQPRRLTDSSGKPINNNDPVTPAFRVQTVQNTANTGSDSTASDIKVDFGYVTDVKTQTFGKNTSATSTSLSTRFQPTLENLGFDRSTGECKDTQNDPAGTKCKQSVTGYTGAALPTGAVKLPPEVLYAAGTQYSKDYVYNPTSGIIAATRSICLPAINGYLSQYATVMSHISQCFKSIAETGKGNAGACNSLISSVVCDVILDALRCANQVTFKWAASQGIGPNGGGLNPFAALSQAGNSVADTISGAYGQTSSFNSLFTQDKLLKSVCIGAFTGDWDTNFVSDILSKPFEPHLDSTCVVQPAERRFQSIDPNGLGKPSYLYYAGGMLVAGSDLQSMRIELICSDDNSCSQYPTSSSPGGQCDCFGKGEQKRLVSFSQSSLRSGETFDDAKYITLSDEWRYDKVKITYSYKDSNDQDVTKSCDRKISETGTTPPICSWQIGVGFRCQLNIGDRGYARFTEMPSVPTDTNGQIHVFQTGEPLNLNVKTEVKTTTTTSQAPIQKFVLVSVKNTETGQQVFSDNFRLDEGVDARVLPGSIYTIKALDFGSSQQQQLPVIRNQGLGSVTTSTPIVNTNIQQNYAVIFPDATHYECHAVSGDLVQATLLGTRSDIPNINCGGISFTISNYGAIQTTASIPATGIKQTALSGSALFVTYAPPTQTSCTSEDKDWSVYMALYDSKMDGSNTPVIADGTKIYADNKYQEYTIPIKVRCLPLAGTTTQTTGATLKVTQFDMIKEVTTTGTISGAYSVEYNKPITSIDVSFTNSTGKVVASQNIFSNAQNAAYTASGTYSFAVPKLSAGTYSAALKINSEAVSSITNPIKVG